MLVKVFNLDALDHILEIAMKLRCSGALLSFLSMWTRLGFTRAFAMTGRSGHRTAHSARMHGAGTCGSLYHERRQAEHEVDPAHPFRNLTPTRVLVMADNPTP
jgi:hypothetical protein